MFGGGYTIHYFHTFKEKERVISKCFTADTFISAQVSSAARRGAELFLLFLSSRIQPPSLLCDNPSQKNPTLDILTFLHLLQKYLGLRSGVPRNPFCLLAILIFPF